MSEALVNDIVNLIEQCLEKDKEIERLNKENEEIREKAKNYLDIYIENERLHSIIKEVREYIEKEHKLFYLDKKGYTYTTVGCDILEILDKELN